MIISNTHIDRCYIGGSVDIRNRFYDHKWLLKKNNHHSIKLQRHYDKYADKDLTFLVLEECDKSIVTEREQFYIDLLDPYFNINKTAKVNVYRGPDSAEMLERKSLLMKELWSSEEYRNRQSNSHKGERPERKGIPSPLKGKKRDPEIGKKTSKTKTGKKRAPFSKEWRENMGKRWEGDKNPNFGGIDNPTHIENLSKAQLAYLQTEEGQATLKKAHENAIKANTGRHQSQETKDKIGAKARERARLKRQNKE